MAFSNPNPAKCVTLICLGVSQLTPSVSTQSTLRRWKTRRTDRRVVWAEHDAACWISVRRRTAAATAARHHLYVRWIWATCDTESTCTGNVSVWLYNTKYRYRHRLVWVHRSERGNGRNEPVRPDAAGPAATTAGARDVPVWRRSVRPAPTATATAAGDRSLWPIDNPATCWRPVRTAAAATTAACSRFIRDGEPATTKAAVRRDDGHHIAVWEHRADTARAAEHIRRVRKHAAASGNAAKSVWVDGRDTGGRVGIMGKACDATTVSLPFSRVLGLFRPCGLRVFSIYSSGRSPVWSIGLCTTRRLLCKCRAQPTGTPLFTKSTKFNDLPDEVKKGLEALEYVFFSPCEARSPCLTRSIVQRTIPIAHTNM